MGNETSKAASGDQQLPSTQQQEESTQLSPLFHNAKHTPKLVTCFSLAVVERQMKDTVKEFVLVHEKDDRGWWLPGGGVDFNQTLDEGCTREAMEEAGVDVRITGVLRIEVSQYGRMRVIYHAEAKDAHVPLKGHPGGMPGPDKESKGATWSTANDVKQMSKRKKSVKAIMKFGEEDLHLRGPEPLYWYKYLDCNGHVAPVNFLTSSRCHDANAEEDPVASSSDEEPERCECDMRMWVRLVVVDSVQNPTRLLLANDVQQEMSQCPGARVHSGQLEDTARKLASDVATRGGKIC